MGKRAPIKAIRSAIATAIAATVVIAAGCSGSGGPAGAGGSGGAGGAGGSGGGGPTAQVALALAPVGDAKPGDIAELRVRVLNTDGTAALAQSIVQPVPAFPVDTTLQVPAGTQLPFTGEGLDAAGNSIFRAATRADLAAKSDVTVTLTLSSTPPPPPTQGQPPVVQILTPHDGDSFVQGQLVVFQGKISDPDTPTGDLKDLWSSDIQGPINVDPPAPDGTVGFQTVGLKLGVHRMSLLALDPQGNATTVSISIEIHSPEPGPPPPPPGGQSAPRVDSISPDDGPSIGGTQITILGADFQKGGAVYFGGQPVATDFQNSGEIRVFSPPTDGARTMDIKVANPDGGQVLVPNGYHYNTTLFVSAGAANASTQDGSSLHPFSSIGLAAVRAQPGYTVKIDQGTYHETVIVPSEHSISFEGAGAASTIVDGSGGASTDPSFGVVESDDISISGLGIGGGPEAGLIVVGGGHVTADSIAVARNQDGVLVGTGSSLTFTSSTVTQNRGNGVLVAGGELDASGISVTGNGEIGLGVVMPGDGASQSTVVRNATISGNGQFGVLGVIDESIDHLTVSGSHIESNGGGDALPGVILVANAGTQTNEVYKIVGTEIRQQNGSGVQVTHGAKATIGGPGGDKNSIRDNGGYGVGCEPTALPTCPAGGNAFGGNDLGDVDPNCPSTCKP